MSADRGPLQTYEVIWRSGHVERIEAHQVLWPNGLSMFDDGPKQRRVLFHGEIDGQWMLLLAADEADILSVRRVATANEAVES